MTGLQRSGIKTSPALTTSQSTTSQYGGSKPEVIEKNLRTPCSISYINSSAHAKSNIETDTPHFRDRTFHGCYTDVDLDEISKRKSEIQDGDFENAVTQSSACMHNNNDISTDIPMFSASGNRTRLLQKQLDVCISGESNMSVCNRK